VLNLDPFLGTSSLDSLGNSLADTAFEALVSPPVARDPAEEIDTAGLALLSGRKSDGGGGSFDRVVLVLVVVDLGYSLVFLVVLLLVVARVDTSTDVSRTSNGADEQLGFVVSSGQLSVFGKSEGDLDMALFDVIRVSDMDIVSSERRVKTDMSSEGVQAEFDGSGSVGDGSTHNWMRLEMALDVMLGEDEASDAKDDEEGKEQLDSPTKRALLLALSTGLSVASESGPEAAATRSGCTDDELNVRVVERISGKLSQVELLFSRIF